MTTIVPPLDLDEVTSLQAVVSGVRVMVVDDDARVLKAIAGGLSRAHFHVVSADDGAPALAMAAATPPDLAIIDYHMPTPGLEVVRKLKSMYGAAIWICVLTGELDEENRAACFRVGADDVLAKPVQMSELKRRLLAAARTQQAFVETRLAAERLDRRLAYGAEAAAMLAHDLNNGLAVALSNLSFVGESDVVTGDEQDALMSTLRALRRMSGLVSNFVDIARFEDAAVKPICTLTSVRLILAAVVDTHRVGSGPGVKYDIDCDNDQQGYFDPALIERVLHNLVGNATRYCKVGGITVAAHPWDEHDPTAIEITVFNSGPEISAEARQKLFVKYGKGAGGQRGFGLYFSRLACEAHGGSIECRETTGGVCFAFRLPGRR